MSQQNQQVSESKAQATALGDLIAQAPIITDKDLQALTDSKEFIANTYLSVPMYRPLVVKLFGVLDDVHFPTPDMKFWQCKVEGETHAMELVRDVHDMEIQKNQIDRAVFLLEQMKVKHENTSTETMKKEIGFDIREQTLIISKKRFEMFQLQKKIKYRIEEVNEWRLIAEKMAKDAQFKNHDYAHMLTESLINKWRIKISTSKDPKEQQALGEQLQHLQKLSTARTAVRTQVS